MSTPNRRPLAVFVVYTAALLTATHWPGMTIQGPVHRSDLVIHTGAYCLWTVLLAWTGLMHGSTARLFLAGAALSVADEATQELVGRNFDWLDLLADLLGVVLGVLAARAVWERMLVHRRTDDEGAGA